MLKALAWKEWREQRPVVVGGAAFALVVPLFVVASGAVQNVRGEEIVGTISVAFLGIVWPLLAAAAGALTIANEEEGKTLTFLLSRPVSRRYLWLVKVSMAMFAVAVSVAFTLLAVRVAAIFVSGTPNLSSTMSHEAVAILRPIGLASLSVLLFACSVLCSTVLKRVLTAAAAALAISLALLAFVLLAWTRLSLVPRLEPQWFASEVLILAVGVLLVSLIIFARVELFGGGATRMPGHGRGSAIAGALALIIVLAGIMPGVYASVNLDAADVVIEADSIFFAGDRLVMTVTTPDAGTTQVWSLGTGGLGMRPLVGRHTLAPVVAPGSRFVLYRSRRGVAGTRGSGLDLRIADMRGFSDRLVMRDVSVDAAMFFNRAAPGRLSADDRIMLLDGDELKIAYLNGRAHEVIDVAGTPIANATILGFNNESGAEILFLEQVTPLPGGGHVATDIGVFTVANGAVRLLRRLPDGWTIPALPRRDATSVPAILADGSPVPTLLLIADDKIELVDTQDGQTETIHEFDVGDDAQSRGTFSRCATVFTAARRTWRSEEGRSYRESQVLFADCTEAAREEAGALRSGGAEAANAPAVGTEAAGLIRLRGRESGDQRTWLLPPFEGTINRLWLTRAQDRVLVDVRGDTDATSYAMLLSLDREPRIYPAGWILRGPLPVERYLFQGTRDGEVAFATIDVLRAPDRLRDLYPAEETSQ